MVAKWLADNYPAQRAADIGGGKGLLAYILNKKGWSVTVIDPEYQELPTKYRDLETDRRIKISSEESVKRITSPFEEKHVKDFDLLIGLHAHGSNMLIIDFAKKYNKNFFLIPCCVIDEPIEKKPNIDWRESLVDYANSKGFNVKTVKLGFMGKDMALYTDDNVKQ